MSAPMLFPGLNGLAGGIYIEKCSFSTVISFEKCSFSTVISFEKCNFAGIKSFEKCRIVCCTERFPNT